jgi:hypothetical protein
MSIVRWLLLLLPSVLLAQSDDEAQLGKEVQALPPRIDAVASGGYWSRDHQDGLFRLVIITFGWEELASRAFLQWIRVDHDKQTEVVERTIPIKEIAGRLRVVSLRFVLRGKQWEIVISAERRIPEAKATFTITPTEDSYKITSSEK